MQFKACRRNIKSKNKQNKNNSNKYVLVKFPLASVKLLL
jgi:hypothetical protein